MNEVHSCGSPALLVKPAKYSPEDKYGKYRRETKKELFRKEGLL
ncbi:MAG: nucleolar RNA-binding Nop10p family protein [Nanoarchaeota archaeon]|nr:nucleolar RNA-binding Nop10p family protein [Nanoarchaeota archaeon]